MSTPLAIAAVTAVLSSLLTNRLTSVYGELEDSTPELSISPPELSVLSPDLVIPPETPDPSDMLNLFLYQVRPNLGWRNVDYPARNSQGDRVSYPLLALDLHYLLSAYSQEPFRAEIMLGYSMQVLHEAGVLSRELIRDRLDAVVNDTSEPGNSVFVNSTLADQIEIIKVTPESLSSEAIFNLWSAFQTNYRPTVAYHVSVVLIESDRPARSALPVRERRLFVLPFKRPVINAVQPQIIAPTETLRIQGYNLKADEMRIRFDGETLENLPPENVTNREISIEPPADLQAGVKTLQIVHYVNYEPVETNPPDLREGFESNTVAFILRPQITTAAPISVAQGDTLTLSVASPVGQRQRVTLFLGDQAIAAEPRSAGDSPTTSLDFSIPAEFTPDSYLARLRVDGAESELLPETGPYTDPTIEVISNP